MSTPQASEPHDTRPHAAASHGDEGGPGYFRFFAMIGTSMVVMFGLMYLNSYELLHHAWFSETRLFMTMIMGGAMMAVMLLFMLGMYQNRAANIATFVAAGLLLGTGVFLVRSQVTVTGIDYMEGMIPHHSIAILTSERAGIEDLRVRELADGIIAAQRREIGEMEWLIDDIRAGGPATTSAEANARPLPDFTGAPDSTAASAARAGRDAASIETILEDIRLGWENGAAEPFREHFLDWEGARYFEGGGENVGLTDLIENHVEPEAELGLELDFSNVQTHVEGDFAWAVVDTEIRLTTPDGRDIHNRGHGTYLFRWVDGAWKVVHTQSASSPVV